MRLLKNLIRNFGVNKVQDNVEDKVHKVLLLVVPLSICNLRCHYCYLSQRDEAYQGIQPEMKYTPEQVANAFRKERIGGTAFLNICADGETLLLNDLDKYVESIVKEGHYVEIVTNLTVKPMLMKILSLDKDLLKHIEFKCSFHYIELKKKNLLHTFTDNIHLIWKHGCSASIEITPTDELEPYIEELKDFSMKNFGAYPHFTIARNDRTDDIDYLTKNGSEHYIKTWSQFNSEFFDFKTSIFKVKQTDFCYAGKWSAYINMATGDARQCYCGLSLGNVFEHPDEPFPEFPIGKCNIAHCYNGHALMALGLIPEKYMQYGYGTLRDRKKTDGNHFLQEEIKDFFNSKLLETNDELSSKEKRKFIRINNRKLIIRRLKSKIKRVVYRIKSKG